MLQTIISCSAFASSNTHYNAVMLPRRYSSKRCISKGRPTLPTNISATSDSSGDDDSGRQREVYVHVVNEKSSAKNIRRTVQRFLSPIVFVLGVNVGIFVVLIVLATKLSSAIIHDPPIESGSSSSYHDSENRSTNRGGSKTALLALWGRCQAYMMSWPGANDNLAPLLMSRLSLFESNRLGKYLTSICSKLSILGYRLTGDSFEDQIACIATIGNTGLVSPMHYRTRFMDEAVEHFTLIYASDATEQNNQNVTAAANVVILGSGYDTRAYRMNCLQSDRVKVYEVDADGTLSEKKRLMASLITDHKVISIQSETRMPTYVSCDFEKENWIECLQGNGFDPSLPTLVVWEGVTMYLSLGVIQQTLNMIVSKGRSLSCYIRHHSEVSQSDWYIAFDYLNSQWADTQLWRFAMKFVREPYKSSFTSDSINKLIITSGLHVVKHMHKNGEIRTSYSSRENDSDELVGFVGNYGGFVVSKA